MKTKIIFLILTVSAVYFLSSCAKLPVYESKSVTPEKMVNSSNKIAVNTIEKKDIKFGISNDDSDLYLQISFHNQEDLMKIMQGGLKIYFDPECKKKKEYTLSIERNQRSIPAVKPLTTQELIELAMNEQLPENMSQRPARLNEREIAEMICKDFEKVSWKKGEQELVFNRGDNNEPVLILLESDNTPELILSIKMPLNEISVQPGEILAVGIETGAPGNFGGAGPAGAMQNAGMSGGRGGMGGGGGGGRGGMGGGMQGGGAPGMSSGQTAAQPFKFWFLAQL